MIDERHPKQVCGLLHAPGESDVLERGVRISARMVVDQDEAGRGKLKAGSQDVGGTNRERVEAASCDEASSAKPALTAEREEVHLLVNEVPESRVGPSDDLLTGENAGCVCAFDESAVAELEGGEDAGGFVGGEGEALGQRFGGEAGESGKVAEGFEEMGCDAGASEHVVEEGFGGLLLDLGNRE
ncbi:hypothetical protein POL67_05900 [Polyangium sp. rjm3]|uniref:Uncharacterized protein n=1 Tax=Polyangium mundeleinium TaxID=2995306 RepID=A0ABT5EGD0_9BACT|nr:hypothetical protein [Polyangium mundeleinium]MDC0740870.1 hypothetical protein [Polyangium mundeleinium]